MRNPNSNSEKGQIMSESNSTKSINVRSRKLVIGSQASINSDDPRVRSLNRSTNAQSTPVIRFPSTLSPKVSLPSVLPERNSNPASMASTIDRRRAVRLRERSSKSKLSYDFSNISKEKSIKSIDSSGLSATFNYISLMNQMKSIRGEKKITTEIQILDKLIDINKTNDPEKKIMGELNILNLLSPSSELTAHIKNKRSLSNHKSSSPYIKAVQEKKIAYKFHQDFLKNGLSLNNHF